MMPASRKGGRYKRKVSHVPVPIPFTLAAKLAQESRDRAADAPLLLAPNGEGGGIRGMRIIMRSSTKRLNVPASIPRPRCTICGIRTTNRCRGPSARHVRKAN